MIPRLVKLTILAAVTAGALPLGAQHSARPVKIFILAGQSNMEGYGGLKTIEALGEHPTQGHLLKKIKKEDGSYVVRDDVFLYYQRGDELIKAPLTAGQGAHQGFIGPELMFGITMGDYFEEPVLLIKTAWGGKDLYCDFRPPKAGNPAYAIPGKPRDMGASFRKMIEDVHQCLDRLDTHFPRFKGRPYELCGFVWFQGWNDMCADGKIKQQVFDEYARNFAGLVQDLRAEFKVLKLPVVVGEVGVDGDQNVGRDMAGLRAAQAKIPAQPELAGTIGYVRTAPYWYSELDTLPRKLAAEERRVRLKVAARVKEDLQGKPEAADAKKVDRFITQSLDKALADDDECKKAKAEYERHISHWQCHYWGSARVYALVGDGLAQTMHELLERK